MLRQGQLILGIGERVGGVIYRALVGGSDACFAENELTLVLRGPTPVALLGYATIRI